MVSLSKSLNFHCLVLVQPRKTSQQIVDWKVFLIEKHRFVYRSIPRGHNAII